MSSAEFETNVVDTLRQIATSLGTIAHVTEKELKLRKGAEKAHEQQCVSLGRIAYFLEFLVDIKRRRCGLRAADADNLQHIGPSVEMGSLKRSPSWP